MIASTGKTDSTESVWPSLALKEWQDTYATLHMWTQIVGKIRLAQTPLINHWWNVPLYVTARGLTTSAIPYFHLSFEICFDFIDHQLLIKTSQGATRNLALAPKSVAQFYQEMLALLRSLDLEIKINPKPQEVPNPILFHEDQTHRAYDKDYANRHWRILLQADRLLHQWRSEFIGKCSPVHFFWGSFDLAASRFSGRRAPARPEADLMTREGYSHEVMSCGFWPGSGNIENAAFYAYCAPEPPGYNASSLIPAPAFYNPPTQGYVLMYDDVRNAKDPDRIVLDFFRGAYEAAAELGRWDRAQLERSQYSAKASSG